MPDTIHCDGSQIIFAIHVVSAQLTWFHTVKYSATNRDDKILVTTSKTVKAVL